MGLRVATAAGGIGVAAMRAIAPAAVYCATRAFIHARGLVAVRGLDLFSTMGYQTVYGHDGARMEAVVIYCWCRQPEKLPWEVAPNDE